MAGRGVMACPLALGISISISSTDTAFPGSILTCTGGTDETPMPAEVLIEGDRIVAVSPTPLEVDEGAVRILDLDGATVLPGLGDAHVHISWPLDFVFDHPEITAMPEDEHALEVAGVVRTYLHAGYTTLVGAGALKPRVDVLVARAIDKGLIDGPRLIPSGEMITERGQIGAGETLGGPLAAGCAVDHGQSGQRNQAGEPPILGSVEGQSGPIEGHGDQQAGEDQGGGQSHDRKHP